MSFLKTSKNINTIHLIMVGCLIVLTIQSCDKFLDVDSPNSKIVTSVVFSDDATATAAMIGVYIDLYRNTGFASGGEAGLSTFAGLSADELKNNLGNEQLYLDFEQNNIDPNNSFVLGLWTSMYKAIYQTNAILEGLNASSTVTSSVKKQLTGEALFIRAFCHFYLVNTFGNVAVVTSSNYTINKDLRRISASSVYTQITSDLISAESLLSENYISSGRVRPNRSAASALLARVYLYTKDWGRAEDKASNLISNTSVYFLPGNPNDVFLQNSGEAIWQLKPSDESTYTNEGNIFSVLNGPLGNVLSDNTALSYEVGDHRKETWMITIMSSGKATYLPYKYKKYDLVGLTNEYSMVIRLAEMYLIRSEARLQLNKITGAISDLDVIRQRARLPLIQTTDPGISPDKLFLQIMQERRIELMNEWGHRWFDLKRWNRAMDVLSVVKPGLDANDLLYPIPQIELNNNKNLNPQNNGY